LTDEFLPSESLISQEETSSPLDETSSPQFVRRRKSLLTKKLKSQTPQVYKWFSVFEQMEDAHQKSGGANKVISDSYAAAVSLMSSWLKREETAQRRADEAKIKKLAKELGYELKRKEDVVSLAEAKLICESNGYIVELNPEEDLEDMQEGSDNSDINE